MAKGTKAGRSAAAGGAASGSRQPAGTTDQGSQGPPPRASAPAGGVRPISSAGRTAGSRRRGWLLLALAVVAVAAVVGYAAYSFARPPGVAAADQGNLHINLPTERKVEYNTDPPTSGPHFPYIAPWGIHTVPVVKELQVHNLEDGGVMVQYHCPSGCPDLVDKLKGVVNRYAEHVILAPYPGMKHRIALTAWTRIDAFDDFDEARIVRFINAYRGIDHHKR